MPGGVPVAITSPGSSRHTWLMKLTILAQENTISFVDEFCRSSPLTVQPMARAFGSRISSVVTSQGPQGENVSNDLADTHCD